MDNDNWIIDMLKEEAGMDGDSIKAAVKKKLDEFPSLTEGAALKMIATEKGITPIKKKLRISDINEDIKHLNIVAVVKRKFEPRKVMIKQTPSTISNMIIEDQTGIINVVVWDTKKVEQIQKEASEGDTISIVNAYTRKSMDGEHYEIHLGTGCAIKIIPKPNDDIRPVDNVNKIEKISGITDTQRRYIVGGFLVRLFTGGDIFITRCGICKKRVVGTCEVHGEKAISKTMLISGILDDGLSSIRISFFDKVADKLLSISKKDSLEDKLNDISFGIYNLEITGVPNKFNNVISLNVRDIKPASYLL
ncbi:MAG: OB-fold nucleic acid binding domain-containing protein [Candidatus Parvarchaeota archaeon]|nr:OB-fold nucleic acid binding domain-containing protein [Candidatus Parvarchaeota archaeon]